MMQSNAQLPESSPSILQRFSKHLMRMPHWHRGVLMIAIVCASLGGVGYAMRCNTPAPASPSASPGIISPHSGFVGSSADTGTASNLAANQTPWYLSPRFLNIGGSVLGGFLIGWLARAFMKTVTLIALAGGGILAALSYFHIMNVDFTAAHTQYGSAMHWLADQASRLKDVAVNYLPVNAAGLFRTFLGFQRR